jgi:hypothetical protein
MEHSYIKDNQIIEKYLLYQLSEDDAALFEEHLLICSECRNELKNMEMILGQIGKSKMQEVFSGKFEGKQKPFRLKPEFYRMAASLLIFIGLSVALIYLTKREHKSNDKLTDKTISKTDTIRLPSYDSLSTTNHIKSGSVYLASNNKAFQPSSFYESLVSTIYRSADLKTTEPRINNKKGTVIFNWTYSKSDSLIIMLINNKDSLIFQQKVTPPYKYGTKLKPGLYYWQLQTDDELLYTGKFLIRKEE